MAKSNRPAWKAAVDKVDSTITPTADKVVRTNAFADAVAAMIRLESQIRRRVERQTSRVWHLCNLPTATDVRRLRSQLSAVEARLRDVSERLEEAEAERREAEQRGDPVNRSASVGD
jgi:hypothetical protein